MTKLFLDASAWIEYLEGSGIGREVDKYTTNDECFTCAITLAETLSKAIRRGFNEEVVIDAITGVSKVIEIGAQASIEAGRLHAEQRKKNPKFGISDAYVYCCAKEIRAKILTSDTDFRGFKGVIMLPGR